MKFKVLYLNLNVKGLVLYTFLKITIDSKFSLLFSHFLNFNMIYIKIFKTANINKLFSKFYSQNKLFLL